MTNSQELLQDSGRDLAASMMISAVEDSANGVEMNNNLRVLRFLAIHILATFIYNNKEQKGIDPQMSLRRIKTELESEHQFIIEGAGDIQTNKPNGDLN